MDSLGRTQLNCFLDFILTLVVYKSRCLLVITFILLFGCRRASSACSHAASSLRELSIPVQHQLRLCRQCLMEFLVSCPLALRLTPPHLLILRWMALASGRVGPIW